MSRSGTILCLWTRRMSLYNRADGEKEGSETRNFALDARSTVAPPDAIHTLCLPQALFQVAKTGCESHHFVYSRPTCVRKVPSSLWSLARFVSYNDEISDARTTGGSAFITNRSETTFSTNTMGMGSRRSVYETTSTRRDLYLFNEGGGGCCSRASCYVYESSTSMGP
jgi:hypothetical protein